MKKLMIAAVATAMVGAAYAGCDKPKAADCAEVYDVVMNLKTTKCNCKLISTVVDEGGACQKGSVSEDCVAWRTVTTKKVYGVIWSCLCTCSADLTEQSPLLVAPALWDGELSAADAQGNQFFWMPSEKLALDSLMTFKFLGRIGAINGKVETWGTFGDGVYFAGFGTHGALRTKTISGAVAGCWGAPYDCSVREGGVYTQDCPIYDLCDPTTMVADYTKTAVYGTFTVKYNAAKSAKLANGGSLVTIGVIPAQYKQLGAVGAAGSAAIKDVADAKNPSYESTAM